ncbi:hypothetical protein ACJRO7_009213 [Eucalyptus globulus]|uniref:Uncharacterized protein n=1 Tax=Eucalyptus globulus TaxID=34317 RepID=A0ABD3IU50_EUCGL
MSSLICDFPPWIWVLITWLILGHLLKFGLALILFTSIALLSSKKPVFRVEPLEEDIVRSNQETLPNKEDGHCLSSQESTQANTFRPEECTVSSPLDSSSKSGCIDNFSTGEGSEESLFQQYCLADLLSEINKMNEEDDNLIDIGISLGSFKCSRFEIEA